MTVFINLRRKVFIMVFFNSSLCLSGKKSITNYQSWKPCNTYNLFIYLFIYSCIHIFIFFIHLYIYSLFYIMKNQYILEEKCLSWFCQAQPSQNPSLASAWLGWVGLAYSHLWEVDILSHILSVGYLPPMNQWSVKWWPGDEGGQVMRDLTVRIKKVD